MPRPLLSPALPPPPPQGSGHEASAEEDTVKSPESVATHPSASVAEATSEVANFLRSVVLHLHGELLYCFTGLHGALTGPGAARKAKGKERVGEPGPSADGAEEGKQQTKFKRQILRVVTLLSLLLQVSVLRPHASPQVPRFPCALGAVAPGGGGAAQSQHTNYWAPRTRKRHQQEHRPQRPTKRSDPTQHANGRTGDCPGPRKGATTRRNVTEGGGGGAAGPWDTNSPPRPPPRGASDSSLLKLLCSGPWLCPIAPPPPQGGLRPTVSWGGRGVGVPTQGVAPPPPPQMSCSECDVPWQASPTCGLVARPSAPTSCIMSRTVPRCPSVCDTVAHGGTSGGCHSACTPLTAVHRASVRPVGAMK